MLSTQETADTKFAKFKEASDDTYGDLKAGMDSAWNSLGNALKSAASRFKYPPCHF